MAVMQLDGARELARRLRGVAPEVLEGLGPTCVREAETVLAASSSSAPVATGEMVASGFVDGPSVNKGYASVTATAGYAAEHAAFEHEGYHFGKGPTQPPHFLKHAVEGHAATFTAAIAAAIREELGKLGR